MPDHEETGRPPAKAVLPLIGPDPRPGRVIALCAMTIVAGTAGLLALVFAAGDGDRPATVAAPVQASAVATQPLPASAAATSPSVAATTTSATPAATSPATSPAASPSPASAAPARTAGPPFPPALTVGATIGLEVAGKPGLRVRHQKFAARVDRLSPGSGALDRADSRYIVRRGLGFDGCVSFEAANHPGFFLRRFFADLLLQERTDATIYKQEATFCPMPTGDGKAITLLALFPSGFVVETAADGTLHLDSADLAAPTAFVVRRPL